MLAAEHVEIMLRSIDEEGDVFRKLLCISAAVARMAVPPQSHNDRIDSLMFRLEQYVLGFLSAFSFSIAFLQLVKTLLLVSSR